MKNKSHFIFRPVQSSDASSLLAICKKAKAGLTNLPNNKKEVSKLIESSLASFKQITPNIHKKFIFVIENNNGDVVGVSGIKARVGVNRPYYSFNHNQNEKYHFLELFQQRLGPSEIGSLFLSPNYRNQGLGRLLSLSRFLFIKCFRDNFSNTIIAELRGYLTKKNTSPFWEHIGNKFIKTSFRIADRKSIENENFINNNFPNKPIYLNLLDSKIQQYIGAVHPLTEPAKKLLISENFNTTTHIDIFDGGPKLECLTSKIRTIKSSKTSSLKTCIEYLNKKNTLICNTSFENFKCIIATKNTPIENIQSQLDLNLNDATIYVRDRL